MRYATHSKAEANVMAHTRDVVSKIYHRRTEA
jgi:hypothetical protein